MTSTETGHNIKHIEELASYQDGFVVAPPQISQGFQHVLTPLPWSVYQPNLLRYEGKIHGSLYPGYLQATKTGTVICGTILFPSQLSPSIDFSYAAPEKIIFEQGFNQLFNQLETLLINSGFDSRVIHQLQPIFPFINQLTKSIEQYGCALIINQKSLNHEWLKQFIS